MSASFYVTGAGGAPVWASSPMTPIEARNAIPAQLQQGLALYRKLFPPPPPGSFWQTWGPVIETIAVFAAGAAALSMVGAAGASGVASAASSTASTAAPGFTLTTGLPISASPSVGATLSSLSYAAPTVGGAVGASAVSSLKDAASLLTSSGVKSKLMTLTKNLVMSQLPSGTQLSPSDQAMLDNIIQGKQSQFAGALESGVAPMNISGGGAIQSNKNLLIIGGAALIALKLWGVL